jgi:hypothetical protein
MKDKDKNINKNQVYRTVETDPLHRCAKLSDLNLKRIRQSIPGNLV